MKLLKGTKFQSFKVSEFQGKTGFTLKYRNHETLKRVYLKPVVITIVITLTIIAFAQDHPMGTAKPVTMMTGLGDLHHPVSTKNAEAQEFFDQGLRLIYAFNHDEAARSFQKASPSVSQQA